ncbi:MAG: Purine nucleoside phosphorylase [Myxococcaceae bacterium]|jgi:purine-nucleoside phosphorylase|nr:Purine nucleoside phosphorylase [Myxococcaceae bacterium]MEA2752961.1 purine-nucleoside phosphorylase [Myxococcales bacterium]
MSHPEPSVATRLDETVRAVRAKVSGFTPRVGVVLGSGLGAFADGLTDLVKVPYETLPHLPASKVVGHAGNLCFGRVEDVPVVCMQGRVHMYEGHPIWQVVHGVRTMARLGVGCVLITNAAGGLEGSWAAGDLMIVNDHLNLMYQHPLMGPNDDALGTRFPDMTNAYDATLRAQLLEVSKATNLPLREGVYAGLPGPSYETPAEIRMLRVLGAQAVGMSTVPEVIALRHMRMRVAALSCITNMAAGLGTGELDHKEVEATAKTRRADLQRLLQGWIVKAGQAS